MDQEPSETAAADGPPELRRALLGYRRADVERELAASREVSAELRREIAALWLAFARQERAIRELAGSLERIAAGPTELPDRESNVEEAAAPGTVEERLADLDEVLGAIEAATASLGRSLAAGIAPAEDRGEPTATERPDGER